MNKEDRYSHLVLMDPLLCKLSPYLHHTMQSIVIKNGKNDRIVWDGSTVTWPTDIVMNQVTPVAQEAPMTFGHVRARSTLTSTTHASVIQLQQFFWVWPLLRRVFDFQESMQI
jgi:hypothetical protein